jgi:hypothetical protein
MDGTTGIWSTPAAITTAAISGAMDPPEALVTVVTEVVLRPGLLLPGIFTPDRSLKLRPLAKRLSSPRNRLRMPPGQTVCRRRKEGNT